MVGDGRNPRPENLTLLDPSASVIELIEKAWVIVLGNRYGSVAVQAAMSGKPLIFLDSARLFWPYTNQVAFSAGEVVGDMETFWGLLRRLKDSPAAYQELSERCKRFRASYLQPVTQTLAGCIRSLEAQQGLTERNSGSPEIPSAKIPPSEPGS